MVSETDFQIRADILRRKFVASDQIDGVLGPAMNMLLNSISSSCFGANEKIYLFHVDISEIAFPLTLEETFVKGA